MLEITAVICELETSIIAYVIELSRVMQIIILLYIVFVVSELQQRSIIF